LNGHGGDRVIRIAFGFGFACLPSQSDDDGGRRFGGKPEDRA